MFFEIRKSGWYHAESYDRGALWLMVGKFGEDVHDIARVAERFGERYHWHDPRLVAPVHAYAEVRDVE